jgi:hypothetical protein
MTNEQMIALKIGDQIEDCNYNTKKVAEIKERFHIQLPRWYDKLIDCLPLFIPANAFISFGEKFLGKKVLMDKLVSFADGKSCSAIHCCEMTK